MKHKNTTLTLALLATSIIAGSATTHAQTLQFTNSFSTKKGGLTGITQPPGPQTLPPEQTGTDTELTEAALTNLKLEYARERAKLSAELDALAAWHKTAVEDILAGRPATIDGDTINASNSAKKGKYLAKEAKGGTTRPPEGTATTGPGPDAIAQIAKITRRYEEEKTKVEAKLTSLERWYKTALSAIQNGQTNYASAFIDQVTPQAQERAKNALFQAQSGLYGQKQTTGPGPEITANPGQYVSQSLGATRPVDHPTRPFEAGSLTQQAGQQAGQSLGQSLGAFRPTPEITPTPVTPTTQELSKSFNSLSAANKQDGQKSLASQTTSKTTPQITPHITPDSIAGRFNRTTANQGADTQRSTQRNARPNVQGNRPQRTSNPVATYNRNPLGTTPRTTDTARNSRSNGHSALANRFLQNKQRQTQQASGQASAQAATQVRLQTGLGQNKRPAIPATHGQPGAAGTAQGAAAGFSFAVNPQVATFTKGTGAPISAAVVGSANGQQVPLTTNALPGVLPGRAANAAATGAQHAIQNNQGATRGSLTRTGGRTGGGAARNGASSGFNVAGFSGPDGTRARGLGSTPFPGAVGVAAAGFPTFRQGLTRGHSINPNRGNAAPGPIANITAPVGRTGPAFAGTNHIGSSAFGQGLRNTSHAGFSQGLVTPGANGGNSNGNLNGTFSGRTGPLFGGIGAGIGHGGLVRAPNSASIGATVRNGPAENTRTIGNNLVNNTFNNPGRNTTTGSNYQLGSGAILGGAPIGHGLGVAARGTGAYSGQPYVLGSRANFGTTPSHRGNLTSSGNVAGGYDIGSGNLFGNNPDSGTENDPIYNTENNNFSKGLTNSSTSGGGGGSSSNTGGRSSVAGFLAGGQNTGGGGVSGRLGSSFKGRNSKAATGFGQTRRARAARNSNNSSSSNKGGLIPKDCKKDNCKKFRK